MKVNFDNLMEVDDVLRKISQMTPQSAFKYGYEYARSEREKGHWIVKQDHNGSTYGECSQCHSIQYAGHTPYCPHCGAEMTEGDNA